MQQSVKFAEKMRVISYENKFLYRFCVLFQEFTEIVLLQSFLKWVLICLGFVPQNDYAVGLD